MILNNRIVFIKDTLFCLRCYFQTLFVRRQIAFHVKRSLLQLFNKIGFGLLILLVVIKFVCARGIRFLKSQIPRNLFALLSKWSKRCISCFGYSFSNSLPRSIREGYRRCIAPKFIPFIGRFLTRRWRESRVCALRKNCL